MVRRCWLGSAGPRVRGSAGPRGGGWRGRGPRQPTPFGQKILPALLLDDSYRYIVELTTWIEKRSRHTEGVSQCTTKHGVHAIPETAVAADTGCAPGCAARRGQEARKARAGRSSSAC